MSKSLGNAIGLNEPADQAFGKLMSISDNLMWHYFSVLLNKSEQFIMQMQKAIENGIMHPMNVKKDMAQEIVARFWSASQAEDARTTFEALFQSKDYSHAQQVTLPIGTAHPLWVIELLKILGVITTTSEGKRLVESGSVHIDNQLINDFKQEVAWQSGMVIKAGKHKIFSIK